MMTDVNDEKLMYLLLILVLFGLYQFDSVNKLNNKNKHRGNVYLLTGFLMLFALSFNGKNKIFVLKMLFK